MKVLNSFDFFRKNLEFRHKSLCGYIGVFAIGEVFSETSDPEAVGFYSYFLPSLLSYPMYVFHYTTLSFHLNSPLKQ